MDSIYILFLSGIACLQIVILLKIRKIAMLDLPRLQPHLDALTAAAAALAALPVPVTPVPAPDLQPVADVLDAVTASINARVAAGG